MPKKLLPRVLAGFLGCAFAVAAQAASFSFCRESVKFDLTGQAYGAWQGWPLVAVDGQPALTIVSRFRAAMVAGDVATASQFVLPAQRAAFVQEMADDFERLAVVGRFTLASGQKAVALGLVDWAPYKVLVGKTTAAGQPDAFFTHTVAFDRGTPYVAWRPQPDPVASTLFSALAPVLGSPCPPDWSIDRSTEAIDESQLRIDALGVEAPAGTLAQVAVSLRGKPLPATPVYPNVTFAAGAPRLDATLATFYRGVAAGSVDMLGAASVVFDADRPEMQADFATADDIANARAFWGKVGRVTASGSYSISPWFHTLFADLQTLGGPALSMPYQFSGGGAAPPVCPQIYPYSVSDACNNKLRLRYGDSGVSADPFVQALTNLVQASFAGSAQLRYAVTGP